MGSGSSGGGSRTLARGLSVLNALGSDPDGLTVAQLAERTGLDRAVLYRLLTTLCDEGLAVRDEATLRFRLGVALVALGAGAARGLPVRRHARPGMRALMEQAREAVCLTVRDRDHAVVVDRIEPPGRSARIGYHVGLRHPLNRGAHGKAMLALLADAEGGGPDGAGVPEPAGGYTISHNDLEQGIVGIAAPIRDIDGMPVASIGVVAPSARLQDPAALGPSVRALANEITRRLASRDEQRGNGSRPGEAVETAAAGPGGTPVVRGSAAH